jgi:nicotinamide-nucleotide amidase
VREAKVPLLGMTTHMPFTPKTSITPQIDIKLSTALGKLLTSKAFKLATAESCTGGGIAQIITEIPGSSDWFDCGFVPYSNDAKQHMLGVKAETLAAHGAVSKAVALEMATGALTNSQADISISVTGIAGPGGGSSEKPVGTVWIGYAIQNRLLEADCYHFEGDRYTIRGKTISTALITLLMALGETKKESI